MPVVTPVGDSPDSGTRPAHYASGQGVDRRGSAHTRTFERAGVGTWSIDVATEAMRTNTALRLLFEWPDRQPPPTGSDLAAVVHPADRAAVEEAVARLRGTGQEFVLEHRLLLPSGRVRQMHSVAGADRDDAGRVSALHGVLLDVTDLRYAQAQEAEQRDRSRWILGNFSEGYALFEGDVVVEVNEAFCRITGFSPAELVGTRAPYPYWAPDEVDVLQALDARMRASGSGSGEFNAVHRSGRRVRVAMRATSRQPPQGTTLWLVLVRDVTEDRERERDLRSTAATDPLTGISNSRAFRPQLRAAVTEHARSGQPLSLALIDVDHFKSVNDRFGHAVGDEVLIAVVQLLAKTTASLGTLARVGGEEFALLMPGVDSATAHRALGEALAALHASPIPTVGTVTASAGVAELHEPMGDDELYRLADELLYEAKARGRNQVR